MIFREKFIDIIGEWNKMKKKLIGIFVCMLLVGTVLPVSGTVTVERTPISTSLGDTLYVGGNGTRNYTKIQDAIYNAHDGDTIYVYDDSSPYYESLTITRGITLLGEDKNTTIIDGLKSFITIISISGDWVTISGFTIQNCKPSAESQCGGIRIYNGNHITISNNIIRNNTDEWAYTGGIHIKGSIGDYNTIIDNIFVNNNVGIEFHMTKTFTSIENNTFLNHQVAIRMIGGGDFDNSSIIGNTIDKCKHEGIVLYGSNSNTTISGNIIDKCKFGGIVLYGSNNTISGNTISNQTGYGFRFFPNDAAIYLSGSNNQIINNNFYNNSRNAICISSIRENLWDGNYWDDWIGFKYPQLDFLPYLNRYRIRFIIDWHPAQEPYDI